MVNVSDEFLLELVERAGSLQERLSGVFLPILSSPASLSRTGPGLSPSSGFDLESTSELPTTPVSSPVESRLERWQNTLGGPAGWERRIAWDNLDPAQIRPLLGAVRFTGETLTAWAETLREILAFQYDENPIEPPGFLDAADPVPFEELLTPFVSWAGQKLKAVQPGRSELFSVAAEPALQRHLLASLARLSAHAFLTEFKVFCARRQIFRLFQPAPSRSEPDDGPPETRLYAAFVSQTQEDHYKAFFREYSVLARLLVVAAENWVKVMAEFGERLRQDLLLIGREFNAGKAPGLLERAEAGLSDSHHHGRSVIRLKFAGGLKLVYKPKEVSLEKIFQEMLSWLNSSGELLPFKVIKVTPRPGYGWVEYVEQLPCADEAGLGRYYRRLGMLLGLVHLLNGTDCHYENIIASGEYPVLVDAETLLHPRVPFLAGPAGETTGEGEEDAQKAAEEAARAARLAQTLDNSILRTAILPVLSADQADIDFSAFAAIEEQLTSYHLPRWEYINTDSMRVIYEKATISPGQNVPKLEGFALDLARHAGDLSDGFAEMYRFLLANRNELLGESSPLGRFAGRTGRFLFRNTRIYGLLLHYANQPAYLREGIERSLHFEKLSRAFVLDAAKPAFWPVLEAERQSLEEMDIPLFGCNTSCNELLWGEKSVVRDWFNDSGYAAVRDRLSKLSEADLAHQQAIIREALRSSFAGEPFDFDKFMD